jgi:hypothetical protein
MRTLNKIYLIIILIWIGIVLYNLYENNNKNKEGFFFGYSPLFKWNKPLELPKEYDKERKLNKWKANNNVGDEISYEDMLLEKAKQMDSECQKFIDEPKTYESQIKKLCKDPLSSHKCPKLCKCEKLTKNVTGLCSPSIKRECPDKCEDLENEYNEEIRKAGMNRLKLKDEENANEKKKLKEAKEWLFNSLEKRLGPKNMSGWNEYNVKKSDGTPFNDINNEKIVNDPENGKSWIKGYEVNSRNECKKMAEEEGSKYFAISDFGDCKVLKKEENNTSVDRLFKHTANTGEERDWDNYKIIKSQNDYVVTNEGKDLKKDQIQSYDGKSLEQCKKMGILSKSNYISWTKGGVLPDGSTYDMSPGYCKILSKKHNKNPGFIQEESPYNFKMYKFSGLWPKPNEAEKALKNNPLAKPMTGKPDNYTAFKFTWNFANSSTSEGGSGNTHDDRVRLQKTENKYAKTLIDSMKNIYGIDVKIYVTNMSIVQSDGSTDIEFIAWPKNKYEENLFKKQFTPEETEGFTNIKEGHKNCGKKHKETFMNISRGKEVYEVIHTLTKLDEIDMDK